MNNDLELKYCTLDEEQVKEFAYNITNEVINNYIKKKKKEYEIWKDEEYLKKIIRLAIHPTTKIKELGIKERIQLLEKLKRK